MANKIKHTREKLEALVKRSESVADVCRELGLRTGSGVHFYLGKRIKQLGIDTSHFLGCAWRRRLKSGENNKKHFSEILILREGIKNRTGHEQLSRALMEIGRENKCEICGQGPVWNDKSLTLAVDHINGNIMDDRKENLRFICPNCHTQTPNYGSKKSKKICKNCDNILGKQNISGYCMRCYSLTRKSNWISKPAPAGNGLVP